MPLNQSLKGKAYKGVTLIVDRDRVDRFCDAIGEEDPLYRDPEAAMAAGFPEQLAPPTFPTVMQILGGVQVITDPDLGLDYSRVVHGEQAFEWRRPIVVGDELSAIPRIADIYAKGPNEFLVTEAEITDPDGEVVAVIRSTLLSRGTAEG